MTVKAGFQALALGAALVVTSLGADAMAQEEPADERASQAPAEQPADQTPSGSASSTAKADLDKAAIRGAAVDQSPRPTLTSTSTAVPKILGSYR